MITKRINLNNVSVKDFINFEKEKEIWLHQFKENLAQNIENIMLNSKHPTKQNHTKHIALTNKA